MEPASAAGVYNGRMVRSWRTRLLLYLCVLLAAGLATQAGWILPSARLGFHAARRGTAAVVTQVEAGSAAARAGLAPGMRLLAVNGHTLNRPNPLAYLNLSAEGGRQLTFLARQGHATRTLTFRPPADPSQRIGLVLVIIFLLYFSSGLYILAYRWDTPGPFWFGWSMLAIGLLETPLAVTRWFAAWRFHGWAGAWHPLLMGLWLVVMTPVALLYAFSAFAVYRSIRRIGREPDDMPTTTVVGRVFLALVAVSGVCAVGAFWRQALWGRAGILATASAVTIALAWALTLGGARWYAPARPKNVDRRQRRQYQLMNWGAWVSFGPALLGAFVLLLAPRSGWAPYANALTVTLGLYPIIVAYSISRQKLFGFQGLLRRSLQYAFFSGGLGVIFIVPMAIFGGAMVQGLVNPPHAFTWAGFAFLGVIVLSRTTRKPLHDALDRRFFRQAYQAEQVLGQLGAKLGQFFQREELEAFFLDRLADALHPAWAAIYARAPREGGLIREQYFLSPHAGRIAAPPERLAGVDPGKIGPAPTLVQQPSGAAAPAAWAGGEVAAPLLYSEQCLGWVLLGPKLSDEPYSKRDLDLLAAADGQLANGLANVSLVAEVRRRDRIGQELQMARSVQKRLLPQHLPQPAELEIAVEYAPAREVGGDYYDVFELGPDSIALALADVAGKGFPAALLMANIQALVRAALRPARDGQSSQEALAAQVAWINRELHRSVDTGQFATLFAAVVDTREGALTYCNAGHELPLCFPTGAAKCLTLDRGGGVLGLFPDAGYEAQRISFPPGSWLLVFTDGATDAMDTAENSYSRERLEAASREALAGGNGDLPAAVAALRAQIQNFAGAQPQFDDVTLLAVRAKAAAAAPFPAT